jgi:hypothetical protein
MRHMQAESSQHTIHSQQTNTRNLKYEKGNTSSTRFILMLARWNAYRAHSTQTWFQSRPHWSTPSLTTRVGNHYNHAIDSRSNNHRPHHTLVHSTSR